MFKQAKLHEHTITRNSHNELMLCKQSNEEKAWYEFHFEREKRSMVREHCINNKLYEQYLN